MHCLHLIWAHHRWVLQIAKEGLHLIGKETVSLNTAFLFFLLLNLQAVDFVANMLLEVIDLPSHTLVEDHDILQQVQLH